jgi:Zn-dependent M28 family amino/carboxypeptidase
MKRLVLATALLAASTCTPTNPLPDAAAVARSRDFSSGVEQTRLMEDVTRLAEGHLADTPFDCTLFNYELVSLRDLGMPVCNLSRDGAQGLLRERFQQLGLEVSVDLGEEDSSFPTTNVIGELRGTEHPEEVVVVAAHYDAFHAGADDNSTGVAAVLELARLASGKRFSRTVRFIGFDHEEFGNIGSARYVRTHPQEKLVTALVFDAIGYTDKRPGSQKGLPGVVTPTTGDFITVVGNDDSRAHVEEVMELARHLDAPPALGAVSPGTGLGPAAFHLTRSDHASFWMVGRNAVFFTDTASFRSPHYHKDTDTVSTLDPEFLTSVTRLAAGALSYWAEGPQP